MLKVGLTGGYATGKSFVARQLESLGCLVLYSDKLGHQVLLPGGAAYAPTLEIFGESILNADRTINRKILGAIVFSNPELLQQLNSVVHPAVYQLQDEALARFQTTNPHGIAIIEAAILIENGTYGNYQRLIVTTCDQQTQITRGMERDHLSREEILSRLARQMPAADKTRFAHYVLDTNGTPDETVKQIQRIHAELRQLAEA
jgi:dephospho-CoA kinase